MAAPFHPFLRFWRERVQAWYPNLYGRTYFVPPVFMNRTQYEEVQVSGQNIHVTQVPVSDLPRGAPPILLESDVREDATHVKVLRCLHQLAGAQKEVMFVISQLSFEDYLSRPVYPALKLPRPIQLISQNKHRGDFDVLIIHKHYGILVGEIKTIGDMLSSLTQQQQEKKIAARVRVAIQQLYKAADVLSHLMSDQANSPRIQKTLMLPNVTTAQLRSVLTAYPQLSADMCQCLNVASSADPTSMCLTSDALTNASQWWQRRMTGAGIDPAMTEPLYLDLVSRFCGPATTVTVACTSLPRLHIDIRTEGEGVSETGWQFTQLVLHPSQVSALNVSEKLVFLTGHPGCGKTLILVLKALEWLQLGKLVQVVSTEDFSNAVSCMIFEQLLQTAGPSAKGRLKLHKFDCAGQNQEEAVKTAVTTLLESTEGEELYIISDEVPSTLRVLLTELLCQSPGLHFWAAQMANDNIPDEMTKVILTEPLRTPPSVTKEVQQCSEMSEKGSVYKYTPTPSPLPCDGPAPRVVLHIGEKLNAGKVFDCEECGRGIAGVLQELHVGGTGSFASSGPPPLHFKDVFVVSLFGELKDAETDVAGNVTQEASGLLRGLRQAGIPVTVLEEGDERAAADVGTMSGPDHVIAADSMTIGGLERKVIVWVPEDNEKDQSDGRLMVLSRCTAQLVLVK